MRNRRKKRSKKAQKNSCNIFHLCCCHAFIYTTVVRQNQPGDAAGRPCRPVHRSLVFCSFRDTRRRAVNVVGGGTSPAMAKIRGREVSGSALDLICMANGQRWCGWGDGDQSRFSVSALDSARSIVWANLPKTLVVPSNRTARDRRCNTTRRPRPRQHL